MKTLVLAVLLLSLASPALGKGRTNPPNDKVVGVIPVSVPAEHTVEASWAWWVGWANYLEVGPFATVQACEVALKRFPVRFKCVPVRD